MKNIIKTSEIKKDVLSNLPISLQLKNEIDFYSVPPEIQKLLIDHVEDNNNDNVQDYSDSLEFNSEFSIYNDFKKINSVIEVVKLYLRNYMVINKGSYPFYPDFGSGIKKYINTKNIEENNIFINEEFEILVDMLKNQFEMKLSINVNDLKTYTDDSGSTRTVFDLKLKVDNNQFDSQVII